jgi:hypothetical protein
MVTYDIIYNSVRMYSFPICVFNQESADDDPPRPKHVCLCGNSPSIFIQLSGHGDRKSGDPKFYTRRYFLIMRLVS